jgi:hypothetical protein
MIKKFKDNFEQIAIASHLIKWTLLVIPVSFIVARSGDNEPLATRMADILSSSCRCSDLLPL